MTATANDLLDEQRTTNALLRRLVKAIEQQATVDDVVTYTEAAARLRVSRSTVIRMVADGRLARIPGGLKRELIAVDELDRYVRNRGAAA